MSSPTDAEKIAHYEQDLREYVALTERMGNLLTGVANALKGDPGPLKLHDWSDLPTLAKKIKTERDLAWPHYERWRDL